MMLTLAGKTFTTGTARFFDRIAESRESTAKVYIRIKFEGLSSTYFAQVDTGAAWSMLSNDVAQDLGVLEGDGEEARISTRLGPVKGRLERLRMEIVADEGRALEVDVTFFVSPEWREATFLGYTGLLDRLRIALDSPANLFYFGREI